MYTILHRLKFILTASNQHGVHSPFIYDYVTKCLYTKKNYDRPKSQTILLKSIAYFKPECVWLPPEKEYLKKEIQHEFPSVRFENGPYDILFIDTFEAQKLICTTSEEHKTHTDSLVLVDGIHDTPNALSIWKKIKNDTRVRVTVDLFYCGAVFFRKEQAKQHFKIRI